MDKFRTALMEFYIQQQAFQEVKTSSYYKPLQDGTPFSDDVIGIIVGFLVINRHINKQDSEGHSALDYLPKHYLSAALLRNCGAEYVNPLDEKTLLDNYRREEELKERLRGARPVRDDENNISIADVFFTIIFLGIVPAFWGYIIYTTPPTKTQSKKSKIRGKKSRKQKTRLEKKVDRIARARKR